MIRKYVQFVLALCTTAPGLALSAQSVILPAWVCRHPDAIFVSAFEAGESAVPHDPSNGSGGATGSVTRTLHITNLGSGAQPYYLYVPANYTPNRAWPFLLALHGVSPYPDTYAAMTRDDWSSVAAANGFIVAAPIANDVFYASTCNCEAVSWLAPPTTGPNDYNDFAAVLADVENAYNIERTRIYGWGFSAGGHVMYDLAVNNYSAAFNASTMAAYGVSGGDLAALACAGLSPTQCEQALAALPRRIPVDIHIGVSDPNYPDAQSDHGLFLGAGWTEGQNLFYTVFSSGHIYTIPQLSDIWANLCRTAVVP